MNNEYLRNKLIVLVLSVLIPYSLYGEELKKQNKSPEGTTSFVDSIDVKIFADSIDVTLEDKLEGSRVETVLEEANKWVYRKKPFYVGRANNLRSRFVNQHLSKSNTVASSSFRKHLLWDVKKIKRYKEARNWILKNCAIKFVKVADYDYSLLFETLLIKLWRKKYQLVNDRKDPLEV